MLDNQLPEGLTDAVTAAILRHLVVLVVRNVELVLRLVVRAQSLAWPSNLWQYTVSGSIQATFQQLPLTRWLLVLDDVLLV